MNREIKFRAWNPSAKTMYQNVMVHGNNIVIAKYNIETDSEDPLIEPMTYAINSKPNWVLMQYTGRKDKKGNEIYEGDNLVAVSDGGSDIVVYNQQQASFYWGTCAPIYLIDDAAIVIGNIYENPELLSAKTEA